jgi:hypothetical protein
MQEYYLFDVVVRHNGEVPRDSKGFKVPTIKVKEAINIDNLERHMKRMFLDYQAITRTNEINVEAYVRNSISGTYMNMASYYGEELRFVKH